MVPVLAAGVLHRLLSTRSTSHFLTYSVLASGTPSRPSFFSSLSLLSGQRVYYQVLHSAVVVHTSVLCVRSAWFFDTSLKLMVLVMARRSALTRVGRDKVRTGS